MLLFYNLKLFIHRQYVKTYCGRSYESAFYRMYCVKVYLVFARLVTNNTKGLVNRISYVVGL